MKIGDLLIIKFLDHASHGQVTSVDSLKPIPCVAVGFLQKKTKKSITLQHWDCEDDDATTRLYNSDFITIVRKAITSITMAIEFKKIK